MQLLGDVHRLHLRLRGFCRLIQSTNQMGSYARVLLQNRGKSRQDLVAERQPEVDENGEFPRLEALHFIEFDRTKPSQLIG